MQTHTIDLTSERRVVMSVEEAGAVLGLSRCHAYKSARDGSLPTLKFGRKYVVPVHRLKALLGIAA
jgi:excisionase family DNA binding protein